MPPFPRRRAIALTAFVVFMIVAPVGRSVADLPLHPAWQMYRSQNHGLCAVTFHERVDGVLVERTRHELLGLSASSSLPTNLRRAPKIEDAKAMVQEMCRRTQKPLFVDVVCGERGEWRSKMSSDADACLSPRSKRR